MIGESNDKLVNIPQKKRGLIRTSNVQAILFKSSLRNDTCTQNKRGEKGNMLIVCIWLLVAFLAAGGFALLVYFLFFSHKTLESWSEEFAMDSAKQLNSNDNAGKMNNLIAHSRELVFTSRQTYLKIQQRHRYLEPVALKLLDESRDKAGLVENERELLVGSTISTLRRMVKEINLQANRGIFLPGASASNLQITDLQVGFIQGLETNVEASKGVPELYKNDLAQKYIKQGKIMDLYCARVNLKLPNPDDDLNFELSPLRAPVRNTVSPARLILASSFRNTRWLLKNGQKTTGTCRLNPAAIKVIMSMKVQGGPNKQLYSYTSTTSTACTNGALPEL